MKVHNIIQIYSNIVNLIIILQALLDIYLMENVPQFIKQCIVGYMLLDIESTLGNNDSNQVRFSYSYVSSKIITH